MAMTALLIEECREIYAYLRDELPGVPSALLEELAFNFALDASVDIDLTDIVYVLSYPGPLKVLTAEGASVETDTAVPQLLTQLKTDAIDAALAAGALLIIKGPGSCMRAYHSAMEALSEILHPGCSLGAALYQDGPRAANKLLLVLSGIGSLPEFCGPREGRARISLQPSEMDLPAFLRS